MNDTPLKPWVAAKMDGTVLAAHCNCMAGLGEVCSHVGALLFAVEAGVRIVKAKTCTSLPCKWLMPSAVSNIPYVELCQIDFTSAKTKKRKLDAQISGISPQQSPASTTPGAGSSSGSYLPSQSQINKFYEDLFQSGTQPAVLSLVPPYNLKYCPQSVTVEPPKLLCNLYEDEWTSLSFPDLLLKCKETFKGISCTRTQASNIEEATRGQSKSSLWFQMRIGRITASNFHRACHTDPASPSISLIKNICYGAKFKTKATDWGCSHEKKALGQYTEVTTK